MNLRAILVFLFIFPAIVFADPNIDGHFASLLNFRGHTISSMEFTGDPLSKNVKEKFLALENREFSPITIREILLWYHENGGDSLIQVRVLPFQRKLMLLVNNKQRLKIAEFVFEGNKTASTGVLLQQIEIKVGYEFESSLAELAVQKISLFYSKQGYLASDVKVSFDPITHVLKFKISEGDPTVLSSVSISPIVSVERKELRARYEREVLEVFGMKAGDRIQRDKVLEGIQSLKEWLRDHDFLLARDPVPDYQVAEDGRVSLRLSVDYGSRIRYGFRGNKLFSYRELTALVSDVKEVSSGNDYLSAVRRRVLEAYKDIGYANAKITTMVREDPALGIRYVSLIVAEGEKIRLESIDIEGVYSMSKEEARVRFKKSGSRLIQRDFFHEEGINRAAELFAEELRSEGYLSAKFEYLKFNFNDDHTKVKASILFSEGIQTRVQSVEVNGLKTFTTEEVRKVLALKEGEPFNIFLFENGLQRLKEKYQEVGKLNAQVENEASDTIVKYSKDNSQVFLRIEVDEGPTFRVGDIIVRGNQLTHARVILRELPFISGDVLTQPHLNEAEDNLRKLNLFSSVIVRHIDHPQSDDLKDILILVEETEPGSFDIVPGLRNDLGARLGFELGYSNIGGWNRGVNASAVFNRRLQDYYSHGDNGWERPEYRVSFGFREPYLAEWPVVFTTNLTFLQRQYSKFDANVRRITLGLKRELSRYLSGFLEYSYEQVTISKARFPYTITDEGTAYIGSITPGFIIDSRSNIIGNPDPFNPTKGFYSVNRLEVASYLFGSARDVSYYKSTSHNSTYFRIFDSVVLAFAMNMGWERSNIAGRPIPAIKLFRLGGLGSIRGYNEDGIEVGSSLPDTNALGLINYRAEARIPITGNLGTALFVDAGNLMVDRWSFAAEKLRSSVGTGLRYNTAVGPVILDIAWRLQSDPAVGDTCVTSQTQNARSCESRPTDRYKVHFAIGVF